jgi:hypothetical protein
MIPRFVLGIDPGRKSGVAVLDLLLEKCDGVELQFDKYGDHLERVIAELRPTVVAEAFVINANTVKNTQAPWSLEAIGVARYLAAKYGCDFEVQAQSSAKRFATRERLTALGWYIPGKGHLMNAQQQCLLYVVRHGWWHDLLDGSFTETD